MDTQKLFYKESLDYFLTCLEEGKSAAKWSDLPADIPDNTDSEDFVNTRNLVRDRLDKHIRKNFFLMETQKMFECYKESLEYVSTCLEEKKSDAKWSDLPADIPDNTDSEDFVNTRNLLRDRLDKHIRKMEDCGLVLKRIWSIRKKLKSKIMNTSIKLSTEEDNSQFKDHFKALVVMETTIESIGHKDDKPDTSPDDTTSQALPEERKETEKNQQSADLQKEDSVDEDNKDVVTGDNSNTIRQQPITDEKEMNTEEDKEPQNEDVVKDDESKLREELCQAKTSLDELREMCDTQKEEQDKLIKELEKKRNECKRLETEMKKLEEMNTGLKDEKERLEKQRNECKRLETEMKKLEEMNTGLKDEKEKYKITYEKEYNKVTEENTAYEQRHQKYQKDYNKAKEEKTTLQEKCEELEKYTKKLEDKNSKLKQRLDRPQASPSVQVKELQKRIDSMTTENESLIKRLKSQEKYMKETERSEQRLQRPQTAPRAGAREYKEFQNQIATLTAEKESLMQMMQRPQTAPHAGGRQYKEFQNEIATLKAEKESLMQRLSMVAGMKMRDNNPGIADLSDPNRPEKLAEQFREIYDNAWTNLLDYITDKTDTTDDIAVQQIVAVTQKIFEQCQTEVGEVKHRLLRIIGYPEDTFEKQYTGGKAGHDPIVKMVKDLVQISAERTYERVLQKIKEIREIKEILQIGGKSVDVFLTKCSKLCLFMCVKDPPVVLDFNFKRGDLFDKDKLSAFTTSGDSVGYLVWPVMYLHENGPVMSKGVAQGRKK